MTKPTEHNIMRFTLVMSFCQIVDVMNDTMPATQKISHPPFDVIISQRKTETIARAYIPNNIIFPLNDNYIFNLSPLHLIAAVLKALKSTLNYRLPKMEHCYY